MNYRLFKRVLLIALAFMVPACAAEQDISVKTPTGMLWGSYLAAPNARAAVLILPGSGPTDRNGNNSMGLHTDTYKMLATALLTQGIASLRIDKRGIGESTPALSSEADLRFQTNADDADAWSKELKRQTGLSCVWLAGHSEGALVAELAAQDNPRYLRLGADRGRGPQGGRRTARAIECGPPTRSQKHRLGGFECPGSGPNRPGPAARLDGAFSSQCAAYLISWLPLDPVALLAKLKIPVLVLQGDNDLQITVQDAKLLAASRPDAKLMIVPDMNHILRIAPRDRAGNFATYVNPACRWRPASPMP